MEDGYLQKWLQEIVAIVIEVIEIVVLEMVYSQMEVPAILVGIDSFGLTEVAIVARCRGIPLLGRILIWHLWIRVWHLLREI